MAASANPIANRIRAGASTAPIATNSSDRSLTSPWTAAVSSWSTVEFKVRTSPETTVPVARVTALSTATTVSAVAPVRTAAPLMATSVPTSPSMVAVPLTTSTTSAC